MKPDTEFLKPQIDNIPAELKQHDNWVIWEAEKRDSKTTKIPYDPKPPHRKASSTNPKTWGPFWQAFKESKSNGHNGVGFVLSKDDPFVGFDFDGCWDKLGASAEVAGILQQLNSYTEISPSGKGLRVIAKGSIPPYGRKKGPIEVYSDSRFLTITGHKIPGAVDTIEARPEEIKKIHQETFGKQKQARLNFKQGQGETGQNPDIQTVLDRAFKSRNGARLKKLYDGDHTHYPSQSEADMALCSHLAFWFKDDPASIDQAFRKSGLYRKKFDSKRSDSTYGEITIFKAIDANQAKNSVSNDVSTQCEPQVELETEPATDAAILPSAPVFPSSVMSGNAGYFTQIYGIHLEPPEQFFYMSYLGLLGLAVGHKLTLSSQRRYRPNYFIVLLGESGKTRKSTAIEETVKLFISALADKCFTVCRGAASGEALGKKFEENRNVLLYYDELKVFVNKANIQNSTLLSAVNILFESTRYENFKTKDPLIIDDAHLSVLAASTVATYAEMFSSKYLDIGFNNRLFLVPGDSDKCIPVPLPIPDDETKFMKKELGRCLKLIDKNPVF